MHQLLLATRNVHKTREFAQILGAGFTVSDLTRTPNLPVVEETGSSFEENAILKAISASRVSGGLVVADDSGLSVDTLQGAPGIYSARYAGENATDAQNVEKLLIELGSSPDRQARFSCALALAQDGEILATFEATLDGHIPAQPSGAGGFGYDPIFVPAGRVQTLAELGAAVKDQISHRARAVARLKDYLQRMAT